MMYNEIKQGEIPVLSFLKGTSYAMYVGPELSLKQRAQLKSKDIPVPVIYLPEVLEQLSKSVVKYNFPGVIMPESLSVEGIYSQIRAEFDSRVTSESRLIVKYNGDVLVIYDAKDSFSLLISYLINKCKPSIKKDIPVNRYFDDFDDGIRFRTSGPPSWYKSELIGLLEPPGEQTIATSPAKTAEGTFDNEMSNALKEAEEMIKKLLLKGCPAELILSLINQNIKLSRLRITRQYKILLVDYDKEIRMGPLPKTVFLFFLRHPEGVMFSHLQDHKKELINIYERVCTNDDPQKMEESISRLTNPFDNSICEKCAAVKKSFVMNISDAIAKNYYINGAQGEKKGISLDRNLVEWECDL